MRFSARCDRTGEARDRRRAAGNAWNAKQESRQFANQVGNIRAANSG